MLHGGRSDVQKHGAPTVINSRKPDLAAEPGKALTVDNKKATMGSPLSCLRYKKQQ
jgi:hypothetical protein